MDLSTAEAHGEEECVLSDGKTIAFQTPSRLPSTGVRRGCGQRVVHEYEWDGARTGPASLGRQCLKSFVGLAMHDETGPLRGVFIREREVLTPSDASGSKEPAHGIHRLAKAFMNSPRSLRRTFHEPTFPAAS
jgi:hypothetical protein